MVADGRRMQMVVQRKLPAPFKHKPAQGPKPFLLIPILNDAHQLHDAGMGSDVKVVLSFNAEELRPHAGVGQFDGVDPVVALDISVADLHIPVAKSRADIARRLTAYLMKQLRLLQIFAYRSDGPPQTVLHLVLNAADRHTQQQVEVVNGDGCAKLVPGCCNEAALAASTGYTW